MADRVSQEPIEALYSTTGTKARVSQEPVEALYATSGARARVSQAVIEVLYVPTPYQPRNPAVNHQNPAVV